MQQNQATPGKTVIAVISAISLFFTIIITFAIISPLISQSIITPINTDNNSLSSKIDIKSIENELRSTLTESYSLDSQTLNNLKATIREESIDYTFNDKDELISITFLIDVNSPKLTYQVNDSISTNFISFTCPSIELVQDPNVFCIGYGGQSTIDANLEKLLPYQGKTPNGIDFTIWQDFDDNHNPRLDMYANICNNEKIGKEVESTIKYWLMQHGITNPEVIPINMDYSNCAHTG